MDTLAARIEATRAALERACRERGDVLSGDGRVSEATAAALLGLAAGSLKNMRSMGEGPAVYRVPVNGCRLSYALRDLAGWIEVGRLGSGERH